VDGAVAGTTTSFAGDAVRKDDSMSNLRDPESLLAALAATKGDPWSAYWTAGRVSTSSGDWPVGAPYGDLRGFWRHVCQSLPIHAPTLRILDFGCGNGALGRLLAEVADAPLRSRLELEGVDRARLDQAARWRPSGVAAWALRGELVDAGLPYADSVFDAVVSQHGIEYAGAGALAECSRVLRPSGSICFLMHRAGSFVHQRSEAELGDYSRLVSCGLLQCARELIDSCARSQAVCSAPVLAASARAAAYESKVQLAGREMKLAANPQVFSFALNMLRVVFSRPRSAEFAAAAVSGIEAHLFNDRDRLKAMIRAGLTEEGIREWTAQLASHGLCQIESESLRTRGGEPLAWVIRGSKPP
jgi:SAM-dependent methyltransferase